MAHTINKPGQALLHARLIWALMVVGAAMFMLIGLLIASGADPFEPHGQTHADMVFMLAAFLLPLVLIPVGLFARGQMMKRGWTGDVVTPSAYVTGCVVAWACTEAAALFACGTMMLSQRIWPNVLAVVLCTVMLLLLWPNGRAMLPSSGIDLIGDVDDEQTKRPDDVTDGVDDPERSPDREAW